MGLPSLVLAASFLGFGSLIRESHFSLWVGLVSTAATWALPAQLVMLELHAVGASLAAITLAVLMTNARLMPLCITLLPVLRDRTLPRWQLYAVAHVVAVTSWAFGLRRCQQLPDLDRFPFFAGAASTMWAVTVVSTGVGFFLSAGLPAPVSLGLVFLNPIYFMLLFADDLRQRGRVMGLALGAVLGPSLHLLTPDWGLTIAGFTGGTLAFAADRFLRRRHV